MSKVVFNLQLIGRRSLTHHYNSRYFKIHLTHVHPNPYLPPISPYLPSPTHLHPRSFITTPGSSNLPTTPQRLTTPATQLRNFPRPHPSRSLPQSQSLQLPYRRSARNLPSAPLSEHDMRRAPNAPIPGPLKVYSTHI